VTLLEAVVRPDSRLVGGSAASLNLRWQHGVTVLAVARRGARIGLRLAKVRFEPGDVLLLQLAREGVQSVLERLGCLPLAERDLAVGRRRRIVLAVALFGGALALTASGALVVTVAFTRAARALGVGRRIARSGFYENVDWPVIVLLGAMIPVGEALETTGGAHRIGGYILAGGDVLPAAGTLAVLLVGTMFLSDLVNNAAAVVQMAPIALTLAARQPASPAPFLMAVAEGGTWA
jgi:di/tricarboxylate transporter